MNNFLTFLTEAWPPSKKNGPPSGAQKAPFGNRVGPQKSKPSYGEEGTPKKPLSPQKPAGPAKAPPFGPKSRQEGDDEQTPPFDQSEQGEGMDTNGGFPGQPLDPETLALQQQFQQQQAAQAAAEARAKAEAEAAERHRISNMRAQAEDEVMAALEDKYNDDTDYVEFYPDMLTFMQFNDEQLQKQIKGKDGTASAPTTSTTVMSGGSGASAVGAQTSSDQEVGDKGETPKVPDAKKSKDALKQKKIQPSVTDDSESLPSPNVTDGDEEATDTIESPADREKALSQGRMLGQGERRLFKIKPANVVSGSEFVGEDEFETDNKDELDRLDAVEQGEDTEVDSDSKKPKSFSSDKEDEEDEDTSVPKVKKFGEFKKGKK